MTPSPTAPALPAPHSAGDVLAGALANLGKPVIAGLEQAGGIVLFALRAIGACFKFSFYGQYVRMCAFVGVDSLAIVLLTAFFTGAVLALQGYNSLGSTLANAQLGRLVVLSMVRELGPVLGGLMLASRAGAAMSAELASMRVTEQIDALTTLATNPFRYLVAPRILACLTMLPLLVVLGDICGIFGGYVVGVQVLGISGDLYLTNSFEAIHTTALVMSLVKAATFGAMIGLMATYHGFNAEGGAAGVGKATTRAVVYSAVTLLIVDYFLTAVFV